MKAFLTRVVSAACLLALSSWARAGAGEGLPGAGPAAARLEYNRQIRPILSASCFRCHGADVHQRKANLRLDVREEALRLADGELKVIVPGKPEASGLVRRIFSSDPKVQMPPPASQKRLTAAEKETLRRWIEEGAEYQPHWSFIPPRRPELPEVKDGSWARNEIDRFILARLEAEGLRPSPEASRTALIRRATLDLTGLPPTLGEVDAFLADQSPEAYAKVVDRLLASPHYGERLAVDWLDAARYADTHGYHIDSGRDMSRWREWVIGSFNRDLPFDQFTVEQLAGDLLPSPSLDERVASGFNRNHMINFEGGAIPEEYQTAYIVDRVNTTGTVWMGLTVGCTQCHDHKFDPLTQKDYYQLYGFFNNVPENGLDGQKGNAAPFIKTPRKEEAEALERLGRAIRKVEEELQGPVPEIDLAQAEWEKAAAEEKEAEWIDLEPLELSSKGGAILTRLPDGSIVATGENPAVETYTIAARSDLKSITALRLETLADDKLPARGPGRSSNGNFVLTGVRLAAGETPEARTQRTIKLKAASADFSQKEFPVSGAIDDRPGMGWAILPQSGKPHAAVFEAEEPLSGEGPQLLTVALEFRSKFPQHQPGRFRLSVTASRDPHGKNALPPEVRKALSLAPEKRGDPERAVLRDHYRSRFWPRARDLKPELEKLRQSYAEVDRAIPTSMVMQELPKPRDTFILMRGQYDKRGEKVEPGVPAFLPPLPEGSRADRLGLARWLVHPSHPLTARVIVNRYWQMFFGTGLVKTAEDFGTQGELPSHPELLDWLAVEFREPAAPPGGGPAARGWDVKGLVRRIVLSATYRQSAAATPEVLERDPENRLLGRGPRLRLQAEFIRDQALAVSGLLNDQIGGPSVSPYQPPGLWEELAYRDDGANWTAQVYRQSHGKDLYRRSMYTFWKRTSPPPTMTTFDAPDRETCTVRRSRTNTPLQALILMNDPTYLEASRKLAERMMTEAGPAREARIGFAFRLATARQPSAEELSVLDRLYQEELATYRADGAAALRLLSYGEAKRNEKLDTAELAAWTLVASAILNLDETVTKG
jgi:hypothetical protein